MTNRLLTTAALLIALIMPAAADQQYYRELAEAKKSADTVAELDQWKASNHGYATAAIEFGMCSDVVTVTDPALRAKFDRKYRSHPSFRVGFLTNAEKAVEIAAGKLPGAKFIRCRDAVSAMPWLSFNPGGFELLEKKADECAQEQRNPNASSFKWCH
jgi:hypothetical protein